MSDREITFAVRGLTSAELSAALSQAMSDGQVRWEIRPAPHDTRSLDPTVLVAITSMLGTIVGSVITGLFALAQGRKGAKVIVLTQQGKAYEAAADASAEERAAFIREAQDLDIVHVHVTGGE